MIEKHMADKNHNGLKNIDNKIEEFLGKHEKWKSQLVILRSILKNCGLEETMKWGMPVYCSEGKNIAGISGFKNWCGLWFFQGALLKDKANMLMNAQEGKTKAMRQWRFEENDVINQTMVESYILEAINNHKQGLEVKIVRKKAVEIPSVLKEALIQDEGLNSAFLSLSPGKRREYAEYISEAKRETTKYSRIEKIKPLILEGKGLNDNYKSND